MENTINFEKSSSYLNLVWASDHMLSHMAGLYLIRFGEDEREYLIRVREDEYEGQSHEPDYAYEELADIGETLGEALRWSHLEPATEADQAVRALAPLMEQLDELLKQAHAYYQSQGYLKDRFRRGRTLHQEIMAVYDDFLPRQAEFLSIIEAMEDQQRRIELEALESRGAFISAALMKIMIACANFNLESAWRLVEDEEALELDLAVFQPLADNFNRLLGELTKMIQDQEQMAKEKLKAGRLNDFLDKAEQVKNSLVTLIGEARGHASNRVSEETLEDFSDSLEELFDGYHQSLEE